MKKYKSGRFQEFVLNILRSHTEENKEKFGIRRNDDDDIVLLTFNKKSCTTYYGESKADVVLSRGQLCPVNSSTLVPHICVSEADQHWFR